MTNDQSREKSNPLEASDTVTPRFAERPPSVQQKLRSPERVAALSDGVFAIVMTILVLEIAVPANLSSDSLRDVLEELRPTFTAWVVSFLIAGMYWVAHRDLFARLRAVNRDVVWLNLVFLLPASLIPFGASMLGSTPTSSSHSTSTA
jgi:uncharacterized membrane protein